MRTSVEIALQDGASAQAQKIATGFDAVAQSADGINSALDPKVLEDYNRQLTQIGETYSQLKNKEKNYNQQQINMSRQLQSAVSGAGAGVAQLGAGNVGGAAMSVGGGLSGLASLLGGPGMLFAGTAMATLAGGNALANQYEQRAAPAGRVSALSGQYGTDVRSNTMALRDAMESTTDAVAKYGKTFEEGARAQETFLMAGGRNFGGSQAAAYSQAYGLDFSRGAAFEGLTGRYGQTGGLQSADWLRKRQGYSPAMLDEVIGSMQDLFTQGLSRGVVRSSGDVARSLEYFSGAGATFQGALGAGKVAGMGQVLAGAGGLQNQTDMFMYRAASKLSGGDYLETRKLMESGMTPEMFKGLMGEFDRFGYGKNESIMQLSKMFGMSITDAEKAYINQGRDTGLGIGTGLPEGKGGTTESQYIGNLERIIQRIAGGMGAGAFDVRAAVVAGGEGFMERFEGLGNSVIAEEIHTKNITAATIQITEGISTDAFGSEVYRPAADLRGARSGYSQLIQMIDDARMAGVSETSLYGNVGVFRQAMSRGGAGGADITQSEMITISVLLGELIEATKETTSAVLEDTVIEGRDANLSVGGGL